MQVCRRCNSGGWRGLRAGGGGTVDVVARRRAQNEVNGSDDGFDVVGAEAGVAEELRQLRLRLIFVRADLRHDRFDEHLEPNRRDL